MSLALSKLTFALYTSFHHCVFWMEPQMVVTTGNPKSLSYLRSGCRPHSRSSTLLNVARLQTIINLSLFQALSRWCFPESHEYGIVHSHVPFMMYRLFSKATISSTVAICSVLIMSSPGILPKLLAMLPDTTDHIAVSPSSRPDLCANLDEIRLSEAMVLFSLDLVVVNE